MRSGALADGEVTGVFTARRDLLSFGSDLLSWAQAGDNSKHSPKNIIKARLLKRARRTVSKILSEGRAGRVTHRRSGKLGNAAQMLAGRNECQP